MKSFDDRHNPLLTELKQETATAYFAACKKMVASLEALERFDRSTPSSTFNQDQTRHRAELLEEAAERVFFVIIHREAMRLSGYEEFFQIYGVTAEVRARLGPKRRK